MMRLRRSVSACLALLAVSSLPGCAARGLSFVRDDRIDIAAPGRNETVPLPFDIRWTAEGYEGRFALLFDQEPMKPGQSLLSLVPADDSCRAEPSCPDEAWLAKEHVYVTSDTSVRVEQLPDRRDNNRSKDRHEVTIVLLDEAGRRIGESAFIREFIVDRED